MDPLLQRISGTQRLASSPAGSSRAPCAIWGDRLFPRKLVGVPKLPGVSWPSPTRQPHAGLHGGVSCFQGTVLLAGPVVWIQAGRTREEDPGAPEINTRQAAQ